MIFFNTPIEFKTPPSINDDQCILVIIHDAATLFVLTNPKTGECTDTTIRTIYS